MMEKKTELVYEAYNDITELDAADAALLQQAIEISQQAYAPYSHFQVGAAALLNNGEVVVGTNQENAAYPVGTCAERVLLGTAANQFPGIPIRAMAISYRGSKVVSDQPISPCGMCRQALLEYEGRTKQTMRLILGGMKGPVYIIRTTADLLPFAFTSTALK